MRRIVLNSGAAASTPPVAGAGGRFLPSAKILNMSNRLRLMGPLAAIAGALFVATVAQGQNAFSPGGADYTIAGALPGDQTWPQASVNTNGGVLVWTDNSLTTNGLNIRAVRLTSGLAKSGNLFRVNSLLIGDHEKPQVSMLSNGGAAIVWQGGRHGFQKVFARFLAATGTNFLATNVVVNTYTNNFQIDPAVATLADGSVVVVWASDGQDGSYQGIYAQRFTAAGVKVGAEFRINEFTANNQRSPAVAALAGGGFVVAWVSELQRTLTSVDIYARLYDSAGNPLGSEFPVNVGSPMCATPTIASSPGGGFAIAWQARDIPRVNSGSQSVSGIEATAYYSASWDVIASVFTVNGGVATATGNPFRLNTHVYGDQTVPKLSAFGGNYLCTWVSLGQDNAWEGVYGQFFTSSGSLAGVEFRVNTTAAGKQFQPAVCSDGVSRFLVTWSSFVAGNGFDLIARSYDLIRVDIAPVAGGMKVSWNTQPGSVYQVQVSTDYVNWSNQGASRQAAGYSDSVTVNAQSSMAAYRVIRIQ